LCAGIGGKIFCPNRFSTYDYFSVHLLRAWRRSSRLVLAMKVFLATLSPFLVGGPSPGYIC
jgi:hypothetical protein